MVLCVSKTWSANKKLIYIYIYKLGHLPLISLPFWQNLFYYVVVPIKDSVTCECSKMPLLLILFHSSIYSRLQMGSNAFECSKPWILLICNIVQRTCLLPVSVRHNLHLNWVLFGRYSFWSNPVPNYCSRLSPQLNYNTHWYAGITYYYDHPLLKYGKGEFIFAEQNTFICIFYP